MRFVLFLAAVSVAGGAQAQSLSRALPPEAAAGPAVVQKASFTPAGNASDLLGKPSGRVAGADAHQMTGGRFSQALPPAEVAVQAAPQPRPAPVRVAKVESEETPAATPVRRQTADLDGDVRCVAQAVYHEARGEPMRGQRAVADVVMNRARSGRWGKSACAVVNAPRQFSNRSSWRMPQIGLPDWDRAISIARDAVAGAVSVSSRLMNFRAAYMGAAGSSPVRIGGHVFW